MSSDRADPQSLCSMPHFLENLLTSVDDDLGSESYIDPIGTLIIWSAFGREIFKSRINSVSNDIRNYTVNLLHHFLVRKLVGDDGVRLSGSLQRHYKNKDTLNFKQACLIFLENVFVFSMIQQQENNEVDTAGILGIGKARRLWFAENRDPHIIFTHENDGQILVRQLSLGVSGRYKTPLMGIGFFDANYQYDRPDCQPHWTEAEKLINGTRDNPLGKLARLAYEQLVDQVSKQNYRAKPLFSVIDDRLKKAYVRAFSSPSTVGVYAREFWLQKTGLADGAAGALLMVIEAAGIDGDASPREMLELAGRSPMDASESAKLARIAELEPFLSDCSLLFTLMAGDRTHSISAVAKQWRAFGRNEARLPMLARSVATHAGEAAMRKNPEAARRLRHLQMVANAGEFTDQVRAMATYHRGVMQSRGQTSWLSIGDDGAIKVQARTLARPDIEDRKPGEWYNGYYLPQFRSFVTGLKETAA